MKKTESLIIVVAIVALFLCGFMAGYLVGEYRMSQKYQTAINLLLNSNLTEE